MSRRPQWVPGNRARLLENGEDFFEAVFSAIRQAKHEVFVETFILFEDKVGVELQRVLLEAAGRGVDVSLLVDGFGSADLTPNFVGELMAAGVRIRSFDPAGRWLGLRLNLLRRMHRKLVVVDGRLAYVGGINFSADHLADFGPEAKQDYAVELEGPIAAEIRRFTRAAVGNTHGRADSASLDGAAAAGTAEALFVTRDNLEHRGDIERAYRIAIRMARKRVLIANAYFFPGYRLLRSLRRAARRGVDVQLILQGQPDVPVARLAASLLYGYLQRGGVKIHEYCERPMHGKVAVIDDEWATVGSSNLDPLSLALNLEANVVLRDRAFATELSERLLDLVRNACRPVPAAPRPRWAWFAQLRGVVVFHFLRHFTRWASLLPLHAPRVGNPSCATGECDAEIAQGRNLQKAER